jgi:hypothetical protein
LKLEALNASAKLRFNVEVANLLGMLASRQTRTFAPCPAQSLDELPVRQHAWLPNAKACP